MVGTHSVNSTKTGIWNFIRGSCDATSIRRRFPRTKARIIREFPGNVIRTTKFNTRRLHRKIRSIRGEFPGEAACIGAQIIANRANSMKSTGPTSRAGKNRVRWNSYKHGLLVKALFLVVIDGEERAEFFRFFKALR